MFDGEEGDVAVLPVAFGAAVQEPGNPLSQVRARDFGSADGAIGVLHFPVGHADELNHRGHPSSGRSCICASPSSAGGSAR
jgi:hypothetical protein